MTDPILCPVCRMPPTVCRTYHNIDGKGRTVWQVYCQNVDNGKRPEVSHHLMTEGDHMTSEDAIIAWNAALRRPRDEPE